MKSKAIAAATKFRFNTFAIFDFNAFIIFNISFFKTFNTLPC